jgi:hypothetical protein
MKVSKSFNTLLTNNLSVHEKKYSLSSDNPSQLYTTSPTTKAPPFKLKKTLPKEFSPFNNWGDFITPVNNQGSCGNCYAQSSCSALADRFTLLTNGYVCPILSSYLPTICDGVLTFRHLDRDIISQRNISSHSSAACTGNTISNIMEYLYKFGSVTDQCFDKNLLPVLGVKLESDIKSPTDLPYCDKVLTSGYNTCLDKTTPAIFFRAISFYNVYPDIEYIKNEIFHWGPVVAGMIVYNSFLNNYDGTTIYMGPTKNDTDQGGHAIKLIGWGVENGIEYFWVQNSWGTQWGLNGYFKIKCDVCDIVKNVMALIPDIPNFPLEILDYPSLATDDMKKIRDEFHVDSVTGYKFSALNNPDYRDKIELYVMFKYILDIMPDYKTFWVGETTAKMPIIIYSQENTIKKNPIKKIKKLDLFFCVLVFILFPIILAYYYVKNK